MPAWFQELNAFGLRAVVAPLGERGDGRGGGGDPSACRRAELRPLDFLCIEGSILRGPKGTGLCNRLAGTGRTMLDWVRALAPRANYRLAVGSCAAYGGIPAGAPESDGCMRPAIRRRSAAAALWAQLSLARRFSGDQHCRLRAASGLDHGDPCWASGSAISPSKISIRSGARSSIPITSRTMAAAATNITSSKRAPNTMSELGCLMEHLGCKATQAVGDCNQRSWNGDGSCTHAGYRLHRLHRRRISRTIAPLSRDAENCRHSGRSAARYAQSLVRRSGGAVEIRDAQTRAAQCDLRTGRTAAAARWKRGGMSRAIIGPFNRVEGDLEVSLEIVDARCARCTRDDAALSWVRTDPRRPAKPRRPGDRAANLRHLFGVAIGRRRDGSAPC